MPITEYFEHGTIRKIVVAFATLFNGYKIKKPDGTEVEVPISWSSKKKWYVQQIENKKKNKVEAIRLPRMGFTIDNIDYAYDRQTSSLNKFAHRAADNSNMKLQYGASCWNLSLELFIATKTTDEALQIVEQIIPFFTPSFNITINELKEMDNLKDIPVKLNSVAPDFEMESTFDGDDISVWTLGFTIEANFYKNTQEQPIIKNVVVDIHPESSVDNEELKERYRAEIDPSTAYVDDPFEILEEIGFVYYDDPKFP